MFIKDIERHMTRNFIAVKYNSATSAMLPVEILNEHPAYSPVLAPSVYHLHPAPKARLGSHKFSSDDEVKTALIR
jgi:hypothetical protein